MTSAPEFTRSAKCWPVAPSAVSPNISQGWAHRYATKVLITDAIAVAVAVAIAELVRFGGAQGTLYTELSMYSYTLVSAALVVAWVFALTFFRARSMRVLGAGAEEYRRVAHASLALFGTIGIVAFLLHVELARGYLVIALPLGISLLVVSRWTWRKNLARRRARGECYSTVLVVGSQRSALAMAKTFEREPAAGYKVVGVCVPGWATPDGASVDVDGHSVPVLGNEQAVMWALEATSANTLAVSNTDCLGADGMRALAWQLESRHVNLVVSAGVMDVAGPRLHIRPVAGLPLLHVDKPQYRGASKAGKLTVDLLGAAAALLLLFPVMAVAAMTVKTTSPGPVFYRAERIGLNGKPFFMLKFRSMVVGADRQRVALAGKNQGSGPLFKLHRDPRVTPVGRIMRRLSIDELPQLLNVLMGQMSIVGPRPPLADEVNCYTGDVHRRLLVKPGITGLWQVSGRSDLSWEESVRLDLYYVENWSTIQDLVIAFRTVRAVLRPTGAY